MKSIPGIDGYFATSDGQILSTKKRWRNGVGIKPLRAYLDQDGYARISLFVNGKRKGFGVHTLVALAFIGPPPDGKDQVRHLNRNRTDNRPDNLAWGTSKENHQDMVGHGTDPKGARNPRAVLSAQDVFSIKAKLKEGKSQSSLAREYRVADSTIWFIATGRNWGHLKSLEAVNGS